MMPLIQGKKQFSRPLSIDVMPAHRVGSLWRDGAAAARQAHTLEAGGSNPSPATKKES